MALNLGILVFDEVEVLDFSGPFEVFSVTSNNHPEFFNRVKLIAETPTISARGGMRVQVDHLIDEDFSNLDILLVPGGFGTVEAAKNEKLINWIKQLRPSLKYIISVCTGVSLLGKAGLVDGMVITTHHMRYKEVGEDCPNSWFCTCRRFLDNDPTYTSGGVSAGIDLSLYFVKKHFGKEVVEETVKYMEYNWTDPDVSPCACTCGAEVCQANQTKQS